MAATFDKDMNIITNFLKDMDIIAALDDQPNDVGGLTAAELKAKFDEGGKAIQEYINGTLIPEVLGLDSIEASRAEAEAARVEAESLRQQAETARSSAESARSSAETARIQAEESRSAAEESRAAAEAARAQAEQQRADETAGIVAQATEQANLAGDRAASMAASVEQAAASAAAASGFADAAEQSAQTVAQYQGLSQSWAVGGTGQREGEDTNNAKYWAEKAQDVVGGGSGKKTCRLVVGTSTAGWLESDCDYLCDGTDDDVEIQAAVNALPEEGGTIVLLEGSYSLADSVQVERDCVEIRGAGPAVHLTGTFYDWLPLFCLKGDYGAICNLHMTPGKVPSTMLYRDGIQIEGRHCTVDSVVIQNAGFSIYIPATGEWATIRFCTMTASIDCDASYLMLLHNCLEKSTANANATISLGANCYRAIGNIVDGHSMVCTGTYGVVADNDVVGPENSAAILLQGSQILCHDNVAAFNNDQATYTGKTIQISGSNCIVTGNLTRLKEVADESGGDTNVVANNKVIVE